MRWERNKREGEGRQTILEWGHPLAHAHDILRGDGNIRRRCADSTDKGSQTLSYGPVHVVSYLSYRT